MQITAQQTVAQFGRPSKAQRFSDNSRLETKDRDQINPKACEIVADWRLHNKRHRLEKAMGGELNAELGRSGARFTPESCFALQEETRHRGIDIRNELVNKGVSATAADTITTAWIKHYGSGVAPALDIAYSLAVDGSGNIYVTGGSWGSETGMDYATIKYTATGAEVWVARYNGVGNYDDFATAIAVDGSGNVYVTGGCYGSGTSEDYATIKYTATGIEAWVAGYNGPANGGDDAEAIALDGSGNVYVTGGSYSSDAGLDYATIKYTATGTEAWVARYNGPGNYDDYAVSLAVDNSGNVYVTGESEGWGTDFDYATIKYTAAGTEAWVARYNGPGDSGDYAEALAVDGSGNVYVTGGSHGSGTGLDYATIKYTAAGTEAWIARYNGAGNSPDYAVSIAVDGSGNVYVTGGSEDRDTNFDYATIKYTAAGTEAWVARYNGADNYLDYAEAIALDGSGNVYVTGYSVGLLTSFDYATIKYTAAGTEAWVARYNGPGNDYDYANALVVDGSGNVYVTGYGYGSGTFLDYATIKYTAEGTEAWVARYYGRGNSRDYAEALAVDGLGNVYVTGASYRSDTDDDYVTIKYTAEGAEAWVARYNGPGNSFDRAAALAVDGSGNVYVTGGSVSSDTYEDYATIKYTAEGTEAWVARYSGPENRRDFAWDLAVDGSGNVYVTGDSEGSGTDYDYATIKYNAAGTELWVARYNGPANSLDRAAALAVDGSGNVYVTGGSVSWGTDFDYATIKYTAAGTEAWVERYNGAGNSLDYALSLAVDGSGNVYVTGRSWGSGTGLDYATIKYTTEGTEAWVARYNGPANSDDDARALAVDDLGNVYVTGYSYGSGLDEDFATIKYTAEGVEEWVARYNGPGNSPDYAEALALDSAGNVYVTGGIEGSGTFLDYATIKYTAEGTEAWVARYNGPGNSRDYAVSLAVDGSGNVYVTGCSEGDNWSIYTTIKYEQRPVSVAERNRPLPQSYVLEQNYPNPFNAATTISFSLAAKSLVRLSVFDVLGTEVATLLSEELPAGKYAQPWNADDLPSGVYFYRLQAGSFVKTKKLILLK